VRDLARRNAGGHEDFLKDGAVLRGNGVEKEVLIGKVFGAEEFGGRERVIRMEDNDEFILEERMEVEAFVLERIGNDADVELAVEQGGERVVRGFDDDLHVGPGERFLEELQTSRQPVIAGIAFGADAEWRGAGGRGAKLLFGGGKVLQNGAGAVQQTAAGSGEDHFLVDAVEELGVEFFFGGVKLMAERGLSEVKFAGGCGDAAFVDDGLEETKVFGIERHKETLASVQAQQEKKMALTGVLSECQCVHKTSASFLSTQSIVFM